MAEAQMTQAAARKPADGHASGRATRARAASAALPCPSPPPPMRIVVAGAMKRQWRTRREAPVTPDGRDRRRALGHAWGKRRPVRRPRAERRGVATAALPDVGSQASPARAAQAPTAPRVVLPGALALAPAARSPGAARPRLSGRAVPAPQRAAPVRARGASSVRRQAGR